MSVDLESIVHKLNRLQDNHLWETGKLLAEALDELAKDLSGSPGRILQKLEAHPDAHFTLFKRL